MTKRDEVLEYLKQLGEENKTIMPILVSQLDHKGLAVFGAFCWHIVKNCKVKDVKMTEFLSLLAEINIDV